jgi:hypothetical protein
MLTFAALASAFMATVLAATPVVLRPASDVGDCPQPVQNTFSICNSDFANAMTQIGGAMTSLLH